MVTVTRYVQCIIAELTGRSECKWLNGGATTSINCGRGYRDSG